MAESKYYWIKLKTDFFEQETIDFLMSQKNGCSYIVLYQMLCLKTANNGGQLSSSIGEMIIPYDVEKIVRDTKYFDFDTVTVALELFKQLGLIYFSAENNALQIADYGKMVGSETAAAERMRKSRAKKLQDDTEKRNNVTKMLHKSIDIDNRDKSIDIDNREKIIKVWNSIPDVPKIQKISGSRETHLKARLDEYGIDVVIETIGKVKDSEFLRGKNSNGWVATFDWFIKSSNFQKVCEENYANRKPQKKDDGIVCNYDIDKITHDTMYNDDYDI